MPQPIMGTDMLGAIGLSKGSSTKQPGNTCKKCHSDQVYELEITEGRKIMTYLVCEKCSHKEKLKEKSAFLKNLFKSKHS